MHICIIPSFLFTNKIGAPEGDTLDQIYPFSINSYNYNLSSTNYDALMWYGDLEDRTYAGVSWMEKSRSHFGGNPGISLRNTSLNFSRMGKSSMRCSLSDSMSWMFTEKNFQPFLTHLFACKADICHTETFFGIP